MQYRGRLDQHATPAGWKWKNAETDMWAPLNRAICERSREQDTVTDTEGRNTRRLGNKKYLVVEKKEIGRGVGVWWIKKRRREVVL